MTYDENDDYNGPDIHRRGPFLFMAALVGVILVAGCVAAVSDARAEPNVQTVLPADGVLSITRTGDVWSVTTDGIPSEVKIMSPRNEVLCGVNYDIPCSTVTTFTSTGECAFIQVDGLPGFNSSDPYICLGGTPSTPTPSEPAPSSPPTPTTTTPATTEPSPSPTPTSSPTSTPEPSSNPNPTTTSSVPSQSPEPSGSSSVDTGTSQSTPSGRSLTTSPVPARLADTGTNIWGLGLVMFLSLTLGLGALVIARRTS